MDNTGQQQCGGREWGDKADVDTKVRWDGLNSTLDTSRIKKKKKGHTSRHSTFHNMNIGGVSGRRYIRYIERQYARLQFKAC
jgi:hypothetical protein